MPKFEVGYGDKPRSKIILDFMGAAALGTLSVACFVDRYEDGLPGTTDIVNDLAKAKAAENLVEKDEQEVQRALDAGGQVFILDTKNNVITVTEAEIKEAREKKEMTSNLSGGVAAVFASLYAMSALPIRRREGEGKDEGKPKEDKGPRMGSTLG